MKYLSTIVLAFCAIAAFLFLSKALFLPIYQDFNYYYFASQAAFKGINPYMTGGLYSGYLYPPICLFFLFPFQLFPLVIASKLWIAMSLICLVISFVIIQKVYNQKLFSHFSLILLILTFLFFPARLTLGMGQINMFVLLCLVLALYYFKKGNEALSGIFFSLSIIIKYFPFFLILYLIARKKWKILFFTCIGIFLWIVIGFIVINQNINIYFFKNIFPQLVSANGSYYYNQALSGFLTRLLGDVSLEHILKLAISFIILSVTFFIISKKQKVTNTIMLFELGIIFTVNILLNSFAWQHHFVWLLIPLIFTAVLIRKRSEYIVLFVIFLLLTYNIKNPAVVPILLQSHAFYGALLLWGFDLYLLHKANFKIITER